ncbi:MAG: glycosyltransferase [Deltaproteobacteria bacterium]|nr:glycosyltransferase [Deltaproteobacteria bacterium]
MTHGGDSHGAMDISVVVPVYRNADSLRELHGRLRRVMESKGFRYEMIFVDDGCPDGSPAVLEEMASADPGVAVLSLGRNLGQHRAVLAGLRRARGNAIAVMDADLQDPPEAIPALLEKLGEGFAGVFAGRRGRYESPLRLLTSFLFKGLLHLLCGVPRDAGMYVVMSREMAARLLSIDARRPFVIAMIGCAGLPVASIPVERSVRRSGTSAYSSWKRFKTGCLAVRWVLSRKRDDLRNRGKRMGRRMDRDALAEHNRRQRLYYEGQARANMVPRVSRYLERHVDEMLRFADIGPGDRVLEVGCGMGRYTHILARRGTRVEGLDLNGALLDRLREFHGGRYEILLHCADIADPPKKLEGRFDAVIGFFTLHHLHDMDLCFEAMARLLKPGGRLAFLEPNPYNLLYYVQILLTPRMTWEGDGGIVRMRRKTIFDTMRRASLSRVRMERFGFLPPFLADRRWGAAMEARLERVPVWRAVLPFQLFGGERFDDVQ